LTLFLMPQADVFRWKKRHFFVI